MWKIVVLSVIMGVNQLGQDSNYNTIWVCEEFRVNVVLISMVIAVILALGLLVSLGGLSLLSGAMEFFFGGPKVEVLKTGLGESGFAFGFRWNDEKEPAKFDQVKLRLFNPFGEPTQVEVTKQFSPQSKSFAMDMDFGAGFSSFMKARGLNSALVQIEISSTKNGIFHQFDMKGHGFLRKLQEASQTAEEFQTKHKEEKKQPIYFQTKRTFIADPIPESNKKLKIATNPEFAGDFAAAGGQAAASVENFAVSKVWIDPGCIVCDACEGIYPEVFEVTEDTCLIRPDAPMNDGLRIEEAAEACPVEVIKYTKA